MSDKLLVNNGTLEKQADMKEILDKIAQTTFVLGQKRAELTNAYLKKAGLEALGGGMDLGLDMNDDMGMDDEEGGDVKSLIKEVKSKIEELTQQIKEFVSSKDASKIDADTSLKADGILGKAKEEKGKSLSTIGKAESPKGEGKIEPKKEEGGPEDKKDFSVKPEGVKEPKAAEPVVTEKTAMDPAAGGKKVPQQFASEPKEPTKEGGDPMAAAMGKAKTEKNAEVLEKIKERLAQISAAKKEAQLYPFKDINKQNQDDINKQTAADQASEINSDIKSGEMTKDKTDGFLGVNREGGEGVKTPDMSVSKDVNKAANAAVATKKASQEAREDAFAQARLGMELACQQQLKGLLTSPLKEAMISNMVEAGVDSETAIKIAHNSFIDGYEANQKIVIAETFDTFAAMDVESYKKASAFTKEYQAEFKPSVKEGSDIQDDKVRTASDKSVALRGSKVSENANDGTYSKYWRQARLESRGIIPQR